MTETTLCMLGCHPQYGGMYRLSCRFRRNDAGRAQSRRPQQRNDCTVRALALACGVSYDAAYDALAAAGRKPGKGFRIRPWAACATFAGYRFNWVSFPAVKGQMRETPVTIARDFPEGRFILRTAGHVLALVDGVVLDESEHQGPMGLENRCVYGVLMVIPA